MNFFKKKLKPLASGFSTATTNLNTNHQRGHSNAKNLEDDLYDEYVVEAPPHPSELLALNIDPAEIDVNDPDKLRELYKKAKQEGRDKQTNSTLLARQRQKEQLEEKKRTREEWKYFDSLTSRVEQVVKDSQKTLEQLKESSAVKKLTEPDYELRQTPDEVFRPTTAVKQEKGENDWVDFEEDLNKKDKLSNSDKANKSGAKSDELDEFGCPKRKTSLANRASNYIAEELLEDFGIDLRTEEQKKLDLKKKQQEAEEAKRAQQLSKKAEPVVSPEPKKLDIDVKAAARPRPRPGAAASKSDTGKQAQESTAPTGADIDPFDTSFLADHEDQLVDSGDFQKAQDKSGSSPGSEPDKTKVVDPFDTSYVNI